MHKTSTIIAIVALACILMVGCGQNTGYVIKPVPLDQTLGETTIARDSGMFISDKIAIITVDGLIMNQEGDGFFRSENPVSFFVEQLDKAQADADVKAIIIRINSPGGGVTASDIMYQRLMRLRAARKVPVIAAIEDVGASGAYYIACGSDTIIATPTSVTGSIGVIMQTISFAGTMDKLGITAKAITSGHFKDMLNPLKPLAPDDAQIVQAMVNEYYEGFVKVVAAGRPKMDAAKVRELADGRVYTGRQARDLGLVDSLGYMEDAIAAAKKASGSQRVKVVMYHRPLGYKANAYSAAPAAPPQARQYNLLNVTTPDLAAMTRPQFLYLWMGPRER
jgi:protease-4